MRRAAKVDGNHVATRDHLRATGWGVRSTAALGDDFPDFAVARDGFTCLLELKTGNKRLTLGQALFDAYWPGVIVKANSPQEAEYLLALEYEFAKGHPL